LLLSLLFAGLFPGRYNLFDSFRLIVQPRHRLTKGTLLVVHGGTASLHITNPMAGPAPVGRHGKPALIAFRNRIV